MVLAAAIGALPTTVIALIGARSARGARRNAMAVNEAVNNRPPEDPSLYTMVREIDNRLTRVEGMVEVMAHNKGG